MDKGVVKEIATNGEMAESEMYFALSATPDFTLCKDKFKSTSKRHFFDSNFVYNHLHGPKLDTDLLQLWYF